MAPVSSHRAFAQVGRVNRAENAASRTRKCSGSGDPQGVGGRSRCFIPTVESKIVREGNRLRSPSLRFITDVANQTQPSSLWCDVHPTTSGCVAFEYGWAAFRLAHNALHRIYGAIWPHLTQFLRRSQPCSTASTSPGVAVDTLSLTATRATLTLSLGYGRSLTPKASSFSIGPASEADGPLSETSAVSN